MAMVLSGKYCFTQTNIDVFVVVVLDTEDEDAPFNKIHILMPVTSLNTALLMEIISAQRLWEVEEETKPDLHSLVRSFINFEY